ncbi:MAG TPA: MmgE/PrpD family protein [Xanthobacteraceae bacterium]|nr:MmgE/PrpD family protein [Xanthobacteraceae bacterium]
MAKQAPQELTRTLAEFAAALGCGDLPERSREHCKNLILDALACAVAGHQGEETGQVMALASALAQGGDTSVIGGGRLSLAGATLFNGYLITAVTMCDVHRATMTHVTPEIIPPALAVAERDDTSGGALLAAVAAGCEVTTRIGLGLDYPVFRARGWHGPGVIGPFGAAAAVGSLLKFDADTMARAFGLAGSQAAGTFAAWGTPTVKFHQCRGALSGLMAALLAQQNFVATREFLTAKDGGLYDSYAEGGKPETALAELGRRFELERIALRLWPSATLIQGLNTALFDLVDKHKIDPARVRSVDIALSQSAFDMHGGFGPYNGKFEALLSAHYTAAAILHDRALTLAQFVPARYDDPALRAFASETVAVRSDASVAGSQAKVQVVMRDGTIYTARCDHPLGSFENPLSRAQVEQKFRTCAAGVLSEPRIDEVIEAVARLETFGSVRKLMGLLRRATRARAMAAAE